MVCVVGLLAFVIATFAFAQGEARESRTVQTAQGPVRGYKSDDGTMFNFYGIPYATAPTGRMRFTAPLHGPVWLQPLEAVKDDIICPQAKFPYLDISKYDMREDCLVANVYMPDTEEKNLPVLVYVHGGAYQVGFGEAITPTRLVKTKKIVAVTFNYRLGAHGFLCLGTEVAPGNAGMKDQVALLRWVKKNIAKFGGNPDDVTIGGYSAGSSSVDLLMLSKLTKGLYNKVIPESGASLAAFSVQIDPLQNAKDFAKELNFNNVDDIHALEEFYTSTPYEVLTPENFFDRKDSTFFFSPCVERDIGVEKFLDDTPLNILTQGKYRKVPMLYGFANKEGIIHLDKMERLIDGMNKRFADYLPGNLKFKDDKERDEVAHAVKQFYFGDKPVSIDTIDGYIDYFSDILITYAHLRSVKLQVEAGSDGIYLYEYSFFSPLPQNIGLPEFILNIKGAGHVAQSIAINDNVKFSMDNAIVSDKMRENLIELWLNFITTGKPVPEGSKFPSWPPVGPNRSPYMDLNEELTLKGPLLEQRARLWDDIYDRYYKSPIPPSPTTIKTEL